MNNFLKKICKIIFVISFILLVVSITLKDTVVTTISVGFTKNDITYRIIDVIAENFSEFDAYTLERIKNKVNSSSEIDHIANIYFNTLLYDIKNNTISEIDIKDDLNELLNNNLNEVPPSYQNFIREKVNNIDFDKLYVKLLDYVKNETSTEIKQVINIFGIFTSNIVRAVLIALLVLSILVLLKLNKIKREALYDFGISLLITGGIMIVLLFVLRQVLAYLIALVYGSSTTTSLTLLTICGFGSLIVGMILIDIYDKNDDEEVNAKKSHLKLKSKKLRK